MTDQYIEELKQDWQSIGATEKNLDFDTLRKGIVRRTRISKLWLMAELVLTLICIAVGIYLAIHLGGWLGWSSAIMLSGFVSVFFLWTWQVRRSAMHWEDHGPEAILAFGCKDLKSRIQLVKILRVHCWSLLAFIAVLWALEFTGLIDEQQFLILFTLVSVAVVAPLWLVLKRRNENLTRQLQRYIKLSENLRET